MKLKTTTSEKCNLINLTKKDRGSGIRLYKDRICIIFEIESCDWDAYINGETISDNGVDSFTSLLSQIVAERKKVSYIEEAKELIFINNLEVLKKILPKGIEEGHKEEFSGFISFSDYVTDDFVFRNIDRISNTSWKRLCRQFPDTTRVGSAVKFLDSFECLWVDIKFSLAYMTQKLFYKDIKKDLWEEMKKDKVFFTDRLTYKDMSVGSKAGLFCRFENTEWKNMLFQVIKDVISYDKKSAYPSILATDDKFPLGKVYRMKGSFNQIWVGFCEAYRQGKWIKIVIEGDKDIPNTFYMFKAKKDKNIYGLEFSDIKSLQYLGITGEQLKNICKNNKFRVYKSVRTGYLSKEFRDEIIKKYLIKNQIKDKSDPTRFQQKTQLDMLYGKALQKKEYESIQDVNKNYKFRGDRYLLPQQSMHAVAQCRAELIYIITNMLDYVVNYDTDGIKMVWSQEVEDFMKSIHLEIVKKNVKAGYEHCDIGTWDIEFECDRYIQLAPKCYIYETDGEVHPVLAGIHEDYLEIFMKKLGKNLIDYVFERGGIECKVPSDWIYVQKEKKFYRKINTYKIGCCRDENVRISRSNAIAEYA